MSSKNRKQEQGPAQPKAERAQSAPGPVTSVNRETFLGIRPRDWAGGGFLLLVTLAMFSKGLIDPASIIHEDAAYQFQPFYQFTVDELKAGRFPHWCPYVSCGVPFHSTLHGAVLYPLHWPLIWMDYCSAYVLSLIVHYFLTALFTYLFIRVTLRCGALAAVVGAMSFAFGGFTFGHVTHWNYFQAYPWFILAVFFYSRAVERSSWRWAVWAAVPVALIGLVGAVHLLLILGFGLGVWGAAETVIRAVRYFVARGVRENASERERSVAQTQRKGIAPGIAPLTARRSIPNVVLPLVSVGIACALGGLIAFVQLWPAQLQSDLSTRGGGVSFDFITEMCAHPTRTVERMIVPFLYGNYNLGYWGDGNYHETTYYAGIIPLAAGLLALGMCWRNRWVPRLAIFGLLMLVLAAGRFLPFFRLLYELVPGFDKLRNPARIYWWVQLCIACLAAIGIDRALSAAKEGLSRRARIAAGVVAGGILAIMAWDMAGIASLRGGDSWGADFLREAKWVNKPDDVTPLLKTMVAMSRKVIDGKDFLTWAGVAAGAASAAAAAAFFALGPLRRRWFAGVLAALVALDLGLASTGMLHYSENLSVLLTTPDHVRFLQENLGSQRYVRYPIMEDDSGRDRCMQFRICNAATPEPGIFHSLRQHELYGIDQMIGQVLEQPQLRARVPAPQVRLWRRFLDLSAAKYLVFNQPLAPGEGVVEANRFGDMRVYLNKQAFPLAFLARQTVAVQNEKQLLAGLGDERIDLHETALVEGGEPPAPASPGEEAGKVADLQAGVSEYTMRTSAAGPRQLVLSATYHPEWKCTVDGQETPIRRTDFAFMSVRVPAGDHQVRWWYDPVRFRQGLVGTAIGAVLALGALIVIPLVRRRKALKAT